MDGKYTNIVSASKLLAAYMYSDRTRLYIEICISVLWEIAYRCFL